MSDDLSRSTRAAAITFVVLTALSLPVTFGAGGAAGSEHLAPTPVTDESNDTRESKQRTGVYPLTEEFGDSGLEGESALTVGEAVLATQQQRAASGQLDPDMVLKLATQRTKLRGAQALSDRSGSTDESGGLATALDLALIGVKTQVARMDSGTEPRDPTSVELPYVETPTHHSPSAAVFALLERHDVTPSAGQVADIRELDELPEPTRRELTDVLDAYLAYERSTQKAYADVNWGTLQAMSDGSEKMADTNRVDARVTGPQSGGVDVARVRAAQLQLLEATRNFDTALDETDKPKLTAPNQIGRATPLSHCTTQNVCRVQVEGVVSIDLHNEDNTYSRNYSFQLDMGGDDTYNNSAGGAATRNSPEVAALIDFAGNDTYNGRNGGGHVRSVGFLLDVSGNDAYNAGTKGTNGGGYQGGIGFLVDAGGTDIYEAGNHATNGGGTGGGIGFLMDTGNGDDHYKAGKLGTNGGGWVSGAKGFLFDAGGNDTYRAGGLGTNGGGHSDFPCCPPPAGGFLVDAGNGKDVYSAGDQGTNGGGYNGRGFLFDSGGNDTYVAEKFGTNGGGGRSGLQYISTIGTGLLLDGGGVDTYTSGNGTKGDGFLIQWKGFIGLQVDFPVTSNIPETTSKTPSAPQLTPKPTPKVVQGVIHAEGTCDSYDEDGNSGDAENKDGDKVYASIQTAVDNAASGASIVTHPCKYNESVNVATSELLIRTEGTVVLEGNDRNTPGFNVHAANVTIRGFEINNFDTNGTIVSRGYQVTIENNTFNNTEGLHVNDSRGTHILNNSLQNGSGYGNGIGIEVVKSYQTVLRNNTINKLSCCLNTGGEELGSDMLGILLTSTSSATVRNNTIEDIGFGHFGAGGIAIVNNSETSILDNKISIAMRGVLVYGSMGTVVDSNTIREGSVAITVEGSICRSGLSVGSCRSGTGQPSHGTVIRYNTIVEQRGPGIVVTNARSTKVNKNIIKDSSTYHEPAGIKIHGREGRVKNATITSNTIFNTTFGIRVTGADNTLVVSNTVISAGTGIWTGYQVNRDYLRMFRSGNTDGNEQRPTTGTVIRNNTVRRTLNGTLIGGGSSPEVVGNTFVENKFALYLNKTVNPTLLTIGRNHFRGNVNYSIYNANRDAILNASTNTWAGGLPASPPNNGRDNPIEDPYSGVLANGWGGAVSEGVRDGISNVHFCAESRGHCLDPPTVRNLSSGEVETPNSDAEFDVAWQVSDPGDNLETVELSLVDNTDGETEDTASMKVSGGNASRTTRLVARREDGSGHNYTVKLTVTDGYGSTATETVSVPETEPQTPTATATETPTPTPPLATNGTGGGSGTGPGGSGAGGTGGSGSKSTSGASSDAISQESTPSDEEQTVTKTAPPTPTETPTEPPRVTPTPEIVPGFGVVGWLVALVLLVGLFARRRQ